nr:butyrate--CoA ligase AAE11, peroxisomal-like [Ipomoea batatas]
MGIIGVSHRKTHFWSITNFFPVLNTINTRLDAKNIATILRHCEAKVFFVVYEYVEKARKAVELLMAENTMQMPLVVVIDNVDFPTKIQPFQAHMVKGKTYRRRGNLDRALVRGGWSIALILWNLGTSDGEGSKSRDPILMRKRWTGEDKPGNSLREMTSLGKSSIAGSWLVMSQLACSRPILMEESNESKRLHGKEYEL